jgi:hypothetical protein
MRFTILFSLLLFTVTVYAQQKYTSQSLKIIFDQLPLDCKKQLIEKKECDCVIKGSVYPIRCVIDEDEINHIGLKVFDDSIHKITDNAVYSFIERELLKYILDDNQARDARRKQDHVYLYYANKSKESKLLDIPNNILKVIPDISGITMKHDSIKYEVLFTNSHGEKLGMEFPVINTLISGMDKKELDDIIFVELSKDIKSLPIKQQKQLDCTLNNESDLLVSEGGRFIIKDISSNRYYEKDSIKLVYDNKYVTESFSNLFLTGASDNHLISINLNIKSYGMKDNFVSMTVDKFLSHFNEQYKLYFGIEDTCASHLRGTLILYNPSLNFLHLLDIKTDTESLFGNSGNVTGKFYPYIPTHNIKDLFGKDNSKKSKLLDDILNDNSYE